MAYEYHESLQAELLEKAIRLTFEIAARNPRLAAADLAKEAVDAVAKAEAPAHAGLIAEVRRQAKPRDGGSKSGSDEIVDRASEQSFPASDPPAWVWR